MTRFPRYDEDQRLNIEIEPRHRMRNQTCSTPASRLIWKPLRQIFGAIKIQMAKVMDGVRSILPCLASRLTRLQSRTCSALRLHGHGVASWRAVGWICCTRIFHPHVAVTKRVEVVSHSLDSPVLWSSTRLCHRKHGRQEIHARMPRRIDVDSAISNSF